MKKFVLISGAILVVILFGYIVLLNQNLFSKTSLTGQNSPSNVVNNFWRVSIQGNVVEIENFLSNTPKDFFNMENQCAEESDEIKKKTNSSEGLEQVSKSVSNKLTQENLEFINNMSSSIKEGGYIYHKVVSEKIKDNHALLRVIYGKDEFDRYSHLFLLNKENNEWKIFMITSDWELKLINKNYASSNCSENITEE